MQLWRLIDCKWSKKNSKNKDKLFLRFSLISFISVFVFRNIYWCSLDKYAFTSLLQKNKRCKCKFSRVKGYKYKYIKLKNECNLF